ncbi:hypothetical protein [Anaerobacillus sp. 1_MG-2023]|nr:hypothetical protein [Anaerobacillus sp. 1_MG-2023]MDO6654998.1 hypothetical protein [Anaerobacillus sp. 1_MG-2023]
MHNERRVEKRPRDTDGKHEQASVDKPSFTIRPDTSSPPPEKKN